MAFMDLVHTHRLSYRKPDWKAGLYAGLIAGVVFLVLEMVLVPLFMGGSPWDPPRMIAAIVMGSDALQPAGTYEAGILLSALVVHLALSIAFGLILAVIIALFNFDSSAGMTFVVGAVFGLLLYYIDFYGMTAFFPWFAEVRNWLTLVLHAVFGIAAAESYFQLEKRTAATT